MTTHRPFGLGIGDVCELNSGSCPLLVVDVAMDGNVIVAWLDLKKKVHEYKSHRDCLRLVAEPGMK